MQEYSVTTVRLTDNQRQTSVLITITMTTY